MNMNDSMNIHQNSRSFLVVSNGTRKICLMKKYSQKSSWHCIFKEAVLLAGAIPVAPPFQVWGGGEAPGAGVVPL